MATRPPLVLIHGMFCSPAFWESYKTAFELSGYQCHVPALRYHDLPLKEQPHPQLGGTSVVDYKNDLKQFIATLPEEPILIGHSMGGLLVQLLLADGVGKGGVCLTPAAPRGIIALSPSVLRSFWPVLTQWKFWEKPVRLSYKDAKFGMLNRLLPQEQWEIYQRLGWESGRTVFEIGLWPLDINKATHVQFERVTVPLLFMGAQCDRVTPLFAVKRTSEKYPHAEFVELTGHAHWVLSEPGWEKIVERIISWLQANFPGDRADS